MSATVERPKRSREEDADGPSGPSPPKRARLDEQVPLSEETNGAPSANLDPVTPTEPAPGCAMASLTTEEPSLNVSEVPRSQEFWFADGGELHSSTTLGTLTMYAIADRHDTLG